MTQISPSDLQTLLNNQPVFLVDVREPFERDVFHIGGISIPLNEILQQAARIPADQPVVVYCKKGIRSQIAIQRLQDKLGLLQLINLEGGIDAWKRNLDNTSSNS